jgi:hypothetical protein
VASKEMTSIEEQGKIIPNKGRRERSPSIEGATH